MVDDVRAVIERRLEKRRRESVIHYEQRAGSLCDLSCSRKVGNAHEWICRRLHQNRSRVRRARVGDGLRVSSVDKGKAQSVSAQNLVEQTERPAVDILAADDVVARLEELHDRVETTHAARECEALNPTLQRRHVSLERFARGILST